MELNFGYSVVDITPDKSIPLSGLKFREPSSPHLGIAECKMRIAWIRFSDKKNVLFFLADFLFFPDELASIISDYLFKKYNIPKDHLIFGGTHSHSGPALGFLPWEEKQPKYIEQIGQKMISEIDSLSGRLNKGQIRQGAVDVLIININRRLPVAYWRWGFKKKALMLPNKSGPVNPKLKVLQFEAETGKKMWFISLASHPVFNRNLEWSSDYPGLLAQSIKSKGWADEVFVFPGFGGDVRPNYQGRGGLKAKLRQLCYGPDFANYIPEHLKHFNEHIINQLAGLSLSKELETRDPKVNNNSFDLKSKSGRTGKKLELRKLSFGPEINFFIANAEMFVDYELALPKNIFTISCTNNCIGYVPTASAIQYGGYEVEDAAFNNGLDGPFREEDLLVLEREVKKLYLIL